VSNYRLTKQTALEKELTSRANEIKKSWIKFGHSFFKLDCLIVENIFSISLKGPRLQ